MFQIDEKMVKNVAKLSRLNLSREEVTQLTGQLGEILNYASRLPKLAASIDQSVLRVENDQVKEYPDPHKLLQNAVKLENGYVRVPAILDKGDA